MVGRALRARQLWAHERLARDCQTYLRAAGDATHRRAEECPTVKAGQPNGEVACPAAALCEG